jgi:DNA-directed RNA polymerase specialized sigma24 family protein
MMAASKRMRRQGTMHGEQRQRLIEVMRQLAAGDEAAVVVLHVEFGDAIRAALASLARERRARLTPADLDDLVLDACFALRKVARAWRPDGALPWTWAKGRLGNVIEARRGPRCVPFDDADLHLVAPPEAWSTVDPALDDVLSDLATHDPAVAVLAEALDTALSPGERDVLLRYAVQRSAGDPSPSHTVAADLGLGPPAVRQRASRARRKLAALARTDPRYRGLAELAIVADGRDGRAA